jgi:hypothetical protein
MSIIFYEMNGCGHCITSKKALKPEIDSGLIIVKPASEAGPWANGFPAFINTKSGKTHLGAVRSFEELTKSLDMNLENFEMRSPYSKDLWYVGVL